VYVVESYVTVNKIIGKMSRGKLTKITFGAVQNSGVMALFALVYTLRECLLSPSLVQSEISDWPIYCTALKKGAARHWETSVSIYRVIQNDCRDFNNLSNKIHLR